MRPECEDPSSLFVDEPSSYLKHQDRCHVDGSYDYLLEPFSFGRLGFIAGLIEAKNYESALDIGCGVGLLSRLVRVKRYLGVDVSSAAINRCFDKSNITPSIDFLVADAFTEDLTKFVCSFDVIVWAGASFGFFNQHSEKQWNEAGQRLRELCIVNNAKLIIECVSEYRSVLQWLEISGIVEEYQMGTNNNVRYGDRILYHVDIR